VEDCRLPSDAGRIDCCAGIDIGPMVEEQRCCCNIAEFCSHIQESPSLKQEGTSTGLAAIEF
jgi:hypothetical protein